ncbi:hypothetical protein GCM10025867_36510 [Frondihabitans sucicola]|uniref:Uncharacterized protein n=1 Tax=Frondihabitans sucicola TaxID=1268041 RepID=A0ABN6Y5Z4_9MICO|nr:hypothetical protein [Frondihabitans sucicola]BDZ51410.1 hypothetical protein GCM10025867_36510 [Frondihabitans sucicola]
MSRLPIVLTPAPSSTSAPGPAAKTCPFGSNCACVFSRSAAAPPSTGPKSTVEAAEDIDAEVTKWTDLGYRVTETAPDEVLLERRLGLPFCVNVLLCLVTGFLWLLYCIPRSRHPKVDTRRLTRALDGSISTTRVVVRR